MVMKKQQYLVKSMTGFGRSEVEIEDTQLIIELRSVNHRFLEISVKLPSGWLALEEKIRKQVKNYIRRGRVDLFISLAKEQSRKRELQFDWMLIEQFLQAEKQIKARYALDGQLTISDLFRQSELWDLVEPNPDLEHLEAPVLTGVAKACEQLAQMRAEEGMALAADVAARCNRLQTYLVEIQKVAPQVLDHYRQRLQKRLDDWLQDQQIDQDRLMMEVAIFADKADITEECTRLASHLKQFETALKISEPVGRRLDFIIQEMQREINTIGSKANNQAILSWVIQSKSELEKMKEQVQNIE